MGSTPNHFVYKAAEALGVIGGDRETCMAHIGVTVVLKVILSWKKKTFFILSLLQHTC